MLGRSAELRAGKALSDLPEGSPRPKRIISLPSQTPTCHPHIVICSVTQTVVFTSSSNPLYMSRVTAIPFMLLRHDRRILDSLDFAPDFAKSDEPLRSYAEKIDAMPIW